VFSASFVVAVVGTIAVLGLLKGGLSEGAQGTEKTHAVQMVAVKIYQSFMMLSIPGSQEDGPANPSRESLHANPWVQRRSRLNQV
jgi:hypothetical protein